MAIRLLPFRQYDENDVVNLFSTTEVNSDPSKTVADAGALVKVSARDMDENPVNLVAGVGLLGKVDYPHVARNYYPEVPLKVVETAAKSDAPLGVTLAQTLSHDENDENLLRYPQKKAELFAVTSGEAVPIATKGIFTFHESAFDAAPTASSGWAGVGVTGGKMKAYADKAACVSGGSTSVGEILGVGTRTAQNGNADQFQGTYAVVRVNL